MGAISRCPCRLCVEGLKPPYYDINIRPSYTEWIARLYASPRAAALDVVYINTWLVWHGLMFHYLHHVLKPPGDLVKWIKRHVCVYCRRFSPEQLQRCPCNQKSFYCNAHCQAADWAYHKKQDMHKLYKREGKRMKETTPRFSPATVMVFETLCFSLQGGTVINDPSEFVDLIV